MDKNIFQKLQKAVDTLIALGVLGAAVASPMVVAQDAYSAISPAKPGAATQPDEEGEVTDPEEEDNKANAAEENLDPNAPGKPDAANPNTPGHQEGVSTDVNKGKVLYGVDKTTGEIRITQDADAKKFSPENAIDYTRLSKEALAKKAKAEEVLAQRREIAEKKRLFKEINPPSAKNIPIAIVTKDAQGAPIITIKTSKTVGSATSDQLWAANQAKEQVKKLPGNATPVKIELTNGEAIVRYTVDGDIAERTQEYKISDLLQNKPATPVTSSTLTPAPKPTWIPVRSDTEMHPDKKTLNDELAAIRRGDAPATSLREALVKKAKNPQAIRDIAAHNEALHKIDEVSQEVASGNKTEASAVQDIKALKNLTAHEKLQYENKIHVSQIFKSVLEGNKTVEAGIQNIEKLKFSDDVNENARLKTLYSKTLRKDKLISDVRSGKMLKKSAIEEIENSPVFSDTERKGYKQDIEHANALRLKDEALAGVKAGRIPKEQAKDDIQRYDLSDYEKDFYKEKIEGTKVEVQGLPGNQPGAGMTPVGGAPAGGAVPPTGPAIDPEPAAVKVLSPLTLQMVVYTPDGKAQEKILQNWHWDDLVQSEAAFKNWSLKQMQEIKSGLEAAFNHIQNTHGKDSIITYGHDQNGNPVLFHTHTATDAGAVLSKVGNFRTVEKYDILALASGPTQEPAKTLYTPQIPANYQFSSQQLAELQKELPGETFYSQRITNDLADLKKNYGSNVVEGAPPQLIWGVSDADGTKKNSFFVGKDATEKDVYQGYGWNAPRAKGDVAAPTGIGNIGSIASNQAQYIKDATNRPNNIVDIWTDAQSKLQFADFNTIKDQMLENAQKALQSQIDVAVKGGDVSKGKTLAERALQSVNKLRSQGVAESQIEAMQGAIIEPLKTQWLADINTAKATKGWSKTVKGKLAEAHAVASLLSVPVAEQIQTALVTPLKDTWKDQINTDISKTEGILNKINQLENDGLLGAAVTSQTRNDVIKKAGDQQLKKDLSNDLDKIRKISNPDQQLKEAITLRRKAEEDPNYLKYATTAAKGTKIKDGLKHTSVYDESYKNEKSILNIAQQNANAYDEKLIESLEKRITAEIFQKKADTRALLRDTQDEVLKEMVGIINPQPKSSQERSDEYTKMIVRGGTLKQKNDLDTKIQKDRWLNLTDKAALKTALHQWKEISLPQPPKPATTHAAPRAETVFKRIQNFFGGGKVPESKEHMRVPQRKMVGSQKKIEIKTKSETKKAKASQEEASQ